MPFSHLASARAARRDAHNRPCRPLVALRPAILYDTSHLKTEVDALMSDVLSRRGTVLVAWERSMIPTCLARLPERPRTSKEWPPARYDLFWIFRPYERGLDLHATPAAPARGR